jgi:hypothetical protein
LIAVICCNVTGNCYKILMPILWPVHFVSRTLFAKSLMEQFRSFQ